MKRREFLLVMICASAARPHAARAQHPSTPHRVGFVALASPVADLPAQPAVRVFVRALEELGHVEGKNLVLEWRSAEGKVESLPRIIGELLSSNTIDALVVFTTPVAKAAKEVTRTVPIVMAGVGIPVEEGLVQSLARPGGNVTGITADTGPGLAGKKLDILREIIPDLSRVAVLRDSEMPEQGWQSVEADFKKQGVELIKAEHAPRDFSDAFALVTRARPDALFVTGTVTAYVARSLIVDFAAKNRLPAIYPNRGYVDVGGLIAYGVDTADLYRRAARYVDRIFKGAKPAELPIEQPSKFEFIINLKTARALGITVPLTLLARADEVIE
jgi:putative ABC transport system substrate-binding protein